MATFAPQASTKPTPGFTNNLTEHVYDTKIKYQPVKVNYYDEGTVLSTQASTAKKAWGQQKALVYSEDPQELRQEKVLAQVVPNQDGRAQIKNTTAWPYALHAQLTMKFNGKTYGGSGALVGPHHLLTCGHNVFDAADKKWAEEITVYPALNDTQAPFGDVKVVKVYTFSNWTNQGEKQYDIALLILNKSIGKYTGWSGLLCTGDSELSQEEVNIVGYPADKGMKQMWGMKHKIHKIAPEEFEYLIDTNGGQSGSAIWINKYGTPMILGVHTLGGEYGNFGVRLSKQKFQAIVQKISETFKLEKPLAIAANVQTPMSTQTPMPQPVFKQPTTVTNVQKQIPTQASIPVLTTPSQPVPSIAFGVFKWNNYFGDVGIEPPLPPDIDKILGAPCPFWLDKTVNETHLLTLIPKTVNGKPLTLNSLKELVKKPKQGSATQYDYYSDEIKKQYGDTPLQASYWVLLTKDVIPGSRSKSYEAQKQLVVDYSKKANVPYEMPLLLEAVTSILMEYVQTGTRLYSDSPYTFTRCQERGPVYLDRSLSFGVGGFAPGGLGVHGSGRSLGSVHGHSGVGGSRKFS